MERIRFRRLILPSSSDRDSDPAISEKRADDCRLRPDQMRHLFALQSLNEADFDHARGFLCHCVRCKWTFQVSQERNSIVALNNVGEPIEGAEASKRIATLAEGPCPVFANFPYYEQARQATQHHRVRDNLRSLFHLVGLDF
jgi:hypothetical protein